MLENHSLGIFRPSIDAQSLEQNSDLSIDTTAFQGQFCPSAYAGETLLSSVASQQQLLTNPQSLYSKAVIYDCGVVYRPIESEITGPPTPIVLNNTGGSGWSGFLHSGNPGVWETNTTTSQWISYTATNTGTILYSTPFTYALTYTFSVPRSCIATVRVCADFTLQSLLLDGSSVGITYGGLNWSPNFVFSIPAGNHVLTANMFQDSSPSLGNFTGFRLEWVSIT